MTLIDLSRTIRTGMTRVPGLPEVEVRPLLQIASGHHVNVAELRLATHAGTHVDAPAHFLADGPTIDRLPLERFRGRGVLVSVHREAGEAIPAADLAGVEIRPGDVVLLHTGWDACFDSPAYQTHPFLDEAAARLLVERGAAMVGVDCLNVEMPPAMRPEGFTFPVHRTLLGAGVLVIENLTNLGALRGHTFRVQAFPLRVDNGDGAPARVVAEVQREGDTGWVD